MKRCSGLWAEQNAGANNTAAGSLALVSNTTGKETTSVYTRVIDEHLPEAFDVMADMVWRPRFAG